MVGSRERVKFKIYGSKRTKDVMSLSDPNVHKTATIHKEEGASRTLNDAINREDIRIRAKSSQRFIESVCLT